VEGKRYMIETEPGYYLIRAGETTPDRSLAKVYTSRTGAARGLGMARRWMGVMNRAKIVEIPNE
jgi:hypothetical protein